MHAYRSSFATRESSLPSNPPVPVASSFDLATNIFQVIFDRDIDPDTATSLGWGMVIGEQARQVPPILTVDGNVVSGLTNVLNPAPVPNRITYTPSTGDLAGVNGIEVKGFFLVPSVGVPIPLAAQYEVSSEEVLVVMSENVFINTATKLDFTVFGDDNELNVQSVTIFDSDNIALEVSVDGPTTLPPRVLYNGKVDGIEDIDGNDVPLFEIGMTTVP
ncbi:hypothetical protein KAR91_85705 [Candidatus Pacearchaeota archaeon]|nr:hypothetical protein [Candidatus Pacearchaeota archaeon]